MNRVFANSIYWIEINIKIKISIIQVDTIKIIIKQSVNEQMQQVDIKVMVDKLEISEKT